MRSWYGVCSRWLVFLTFLVAAPSPILAISPHWIATWTTSAEAADADPHEPLTQLNNQTVRERARVTLGGRQFRLVLSNAFGPAPLVLGAVTAGLPTGPAGVEPGSLRIVTFDGRRTVSIARGATVTSDPIDLPLSDGSELSVSMYVPDRPSAVTWHALALKRAVVSGTGNHTQDTSIQDGKGSDSSAFLTQILVSAQKRPRVIVAVGDSTTDGDGSTPEQDASWSTDLFRRLDHDGGHIAVVNAGVAGNRLLADGPVASFGASALARFDRDALSVPGATDIILLEGTNDIGFPGVSLDGLVLASASDQPTLEQITGAYKQLVQRAHARGIRVIGATIMPSEGVVIPGYHTDAKERLRQAVNQWIRRGHAFDGVIDFDATVRDPHHPSQLKPQLGSGDHLHPNDAGYRAMADAVRRSLL